MSDTEDQFQDGLSEEYAKFQVHSRQEIGQILRALQQQNEIVTAYFRQGQEFFLTSVVEVDIDAGQMLLDCGPDSDTNQRALAQNKFIFVSSQNRVKIQFTATKLEQTQHDGRPAFRIQLPTTLLKLQRRDYYRLAPPIRAPLICVIPNIAGARMEAEIADISVGGVAITGVPVTAPFALHLRLPDCSIALPDEGTVVAALEVRNVRQTTRRSGETVLCVGCRFDGLPRLHEAKIQRYIIRIERERRASPGGG